MNGLYRTVRTGKTGLIAKKILRIKYAFPLSLHIKVCAHPITVGDENSATWARSKRSTRVSHTHMGHTIKAISH